MEISLIRRLYFAGIPSKFFEFDLNYLDDPRTQIDLIDNTIASEESKQFPCSVDYKLQFLKKLIAELESNEIEVDEKIYKQMVACMLRNKEGYIPDKIYKIFELPNGKRIICAENKCTLSQGTTGLSHWQGTYFLSHWISENANLFQNKHVLELGCGLGLTGMTAIQICQLKSYTFTDANSDVLSLLKENVQNTFKQTFETNSMLLENNCKLAVNELDWSSSVGDSIPDHVDIVLAADVTYDTTLIADLVKILNIILIRNPSCLAYLVHTRRNELTERALLDKFRLHSIEICAQEVLKLPNLSNQILPFGQSQIADCILFTIRRFY